MTAKSWKRVISLPYICIPNYICSTCLSPYTYLHISYYLPTYVYLIYLVPTYATAVTIYTVLIIISTNITVDYDL